MIYLILQNKNSFIFQTYKTPTTIPNYLANKLPTKKPEDHSSDFISLLLLITLAGFPPTMA